MEKVKMSARQARALLKKARKLSTEAAVSETLSTKAAGEGACIIYRKGKGTKEVCEQLAAEECTWVGEQLKIKGAGYSIFFAGQKCPK